MFTATSINSAGFGSVDTDRRTPDQKVAEFSKLRICFINYKYLIVTEVYLTIDSLIYRFINSTF